MKPNIDALAVFGGQPAFDQTLYVGRPNIGDRAHLQARIDQLLDNRWLTNNGPLVQQFEAELARYVGVKHVVAMCNATVALEIAIRATGLKGEVIVPSFTFVATAHALQWQEITPIFADIDPRTQTLDPASVERMITPRTTGIIGVHLWGRTCDIDGLAAVARKHNLALLFDAAHAFGCTYGGRMIGGFGTAEVFSFHATKFLNSFEGGAVATDDDQLAATMRLMRNFGFADYDIVDYVGTNGKMTEIAAAMGLTSLESLDTFVATNQRNYACYAEALADIPGVSLLQYDEREKSNYQYIVLDIDAQTTGIARDDILQLLWAEQVHARRYFYPGVHRMEPYRSYFPHTGLLLPETERLVGRTLCLPTGTAVSTDEIERLCHLLRFVVEHASAITARLATRE